MTKDEYRTFVMTAREMMTRYWGEDYTNEEMVKHVFGVTKMGVWCAGKEHGKAFAEELHMEILNACVADLNKSVEALQKLEDET